MKIVICDDDKALQEILKRKIEKICMEAKTGCQVVCCDSGEEVLRQEPAPDILFLDIQMSGRNGMDIAKELKVCHDGMVLIFVTALSEYVYDAFDVGAFHYLVKPFSDNKLEEVLTRALQRCEWHRENEAVRRSEPTETDVGDGREALADKTRAILVKRGGISTKVQLEDIIYAEVFNRKVTLHTTDGEIEYYGKLTELSEQVGEDFYRTHRAYLINLKYVEKYNATTIWMEKGKVLVSKKQFSGFVQRYMQYINRKRGR
ncbi:MAG: LytTR family DNA-binding domain-containing protein [Lachnospiraceae bacterium]|nr:LytTR family DNA-binding domain-containing protein [Lachnospiraceae bacterium]